MRWAFAALALAVLAGCGDAEPQHAMRVCGGSYDNVIATTEATPDVHCNEALVFAGHVVGYTIAPSPCFRGGEYGGAVVSPCDVNGWTCEIRDRQEPRRGVFDCVDEDRDRRLRLTALYPLGERPRMWDDDDEFDPSDRKGSYRRYHLICRDLPLEELAKAYQTTIDRDAVLAGIREWMGIEEAARGCESGFRARSALARAGGELIDSES